MPEHQPVNAEKDDLRPGRLFEHIVYTTGYNGPDGPEAVIFEITEVTDDGKVYYGPAQRGIETVATLWIWEHLFERDALRSWVGERPTPPAACGCPVSGFGYRHHRHPCPRAGENESVIPPAEGTDVE